MEPTVRLRNVEAGDLPVLYEYQRDPIAIAMAAFPSRDWQAFTAHWTRVLGDAGIIKKTVIAGTEIAGHIVCFERSNEHCVGYWLGRQFWGKGITSRALAEFTAVVDVRPLVAYVADHNAASIRVLEKCGFVVTGERMAAADTGGPVVRELVLTLG